jgi:hypothetical protein
MINKADTIKLSAPAAKVRVGFVPEPIDDVVPSPLDILRQRQACSEVRRGLNVWYYEQGGAS